MSHFEFPRGKQASRQPTLRKNAALAVILAITVFLAGRTASAWSLFATPSCGARIGKLVRADRAQITGGDDEVTYLKSTRIVGTVEGNFGHDRLVVERDGGAWFSTFSALKNAPQGDPRWMAIALGPEAASFLGYEVKSNTLAIIPSAEELSAAIEKFNAGLSPQAPELIQVTYYSSEKPQVPSRDYLFQFIHRAALPVSPEESTRIHDLSWHSGAIFIPNDVINLARRQTKATLDFVDYLKNQNPNWKSDPTLSRAVPRLLHRRTTLIDNGTGNIIYGIAQSAFTKSPADNLKGVFHDLVGGGRTNSGRSAREIDKPCSPGQYLESAVLNLEYEGMVPAGVNFIQSELKKFKSIAPPESLEGAIDYGADQFCAKVIERREQLKGRMLQLKQAP